MKGPTPSAAQEDKHLQAPGLGSALRLGHNRSAIGSLLPSYFFVCFFHNDQGFPGAKSCGQPCAQAPSVARDSCGAQSTSKVHSTQTLLVADLRPLHTALHQLA